MYVRLYSRLQIKVGGKKESHILQLFVVYGLDEPGFKSRLGQGIFLFSRSSKLALGLFLFNGYKSPFLGLKRPGRDADNSRLCSVEVKNKWSCTYITLYALMMWRGTTFLF
jgi:hypothetical protein